MKQCAMCQGRRVLTTRAAVVTACPACNLQPGHEVLASCGHWHEVYFKPIPGETDIEALMLFFRCGDIESFAGHAGSPPRRRARNHPRLRRSPAELISSASKPPPPD